MNRSLALLLLSFSLVFSLPVTIVKNTSGSTITNLPVTLSLQFCEGELNDGIGARSAGTAVTTQWDIKRTWPGGSIKHALVSMIIPSIAANDSARITLDNALTVTDNTPISVSSILASDFDATVTFTNLHSNATASRTGSVSARTLLSGLGTPVYWTKGPVATEFILRGKPVLNGGGTDTTIGVQYEVRFYQGLNRAIVSVVGENTYEKSIQNLWYDLGITLGEASPASAYTKTGVNHFYCSRWRKVLTWGTPFPSFEIHYDIPYLITTGLIERYNLSHTVTASQRSADSASWVSGSPAAYASSYAPANGTDILCFGKITAGMGTTGGRPDIGPNPAWVARWLYSQTKLYRDIACGTANCAGTFQIHYRPSDTTRLIDIKRRPNASLNWWCYGQSNSDIKKPVDSCYNPGGPDDAHQPNMVYIPYLLTGDYYYLEELYYWANWNILGQHWGYRFYDKGYYASQVRGDAWGMWRTIAEAAAIAADGHYEKGYFDALVRYNIHYNDSLKLRQGTSDNNAIGVWRPGDMNCSAPQTGDCGCFSADASHLTSAWMDDFVTMMLDHTVDLGYDEAIPLRDWKLIFPAGRYGRPGLYNPYDGTAYRLATRYKIDSTRYQTVNDFTTLHAKSWGKVGCGGATTLDQGEYTFWARAALSACSRSTTPYADSAYRFIDTRLNPSLDMDQRVDFVAGPPRTRYTVGIENVSPAARVPLRLSAFPSPFTSAVSLRLTGLRDKGLSSLKVYNIQGKMVADLSNHVMKTGVNWSAKGLPSGFYFVKLKSGQTQITKRVLLVK